MAFDSLDYGSSKIATHSFTEGAEERHVERLAPGAGVLGAWDDSATVTAAGVVSDFSVPAVGKGRIIVGCLCNEALGAELQIRLIFKNSNGLVVGLSAVASSTLTEVTDGETVPKRYGTVIVFSNDVGASTVEMYVVSLPGSATSVDINMAAV